MIAEMARVTRPGGLVLAAEPNNLATSLVLNSVTFGDPVEEILAAVRLQLMCERGKAALGEGNNSVGDIAPGLFAAAGLADVAVYLNDKTNALLPPYRTPEQTALLEERRDFDSRDFWIWSRADSLRYFLAGGGIAAEFDALWASVTRDCPTIRNGDRETNLRAIGRLAELPYRRQKRPADARETNHLIQSGSPLE